MRFRAGVLAVAITLVVLIGHVGAAPPLPHATAPNVLTPGHVGRWDDLVVYLPRICLNLDGSVYRAPTGEAWIAYAGSGRQSGRDNDQIGMLTTTDFETFSRRSLLERPAIPFGHGYYDDSGFTWDGTDVAPTSCFHANGQFILFFEGNRYSNAHGDQVEIGVATSPDGLTWTKYAGNPIVRRGAWGVDAGDIYAFNVVYEADEPDPGKRWKAWYTGHDGDGDGHGAYSIVYAYAASFFGPWTKRTTTTTRSRSTGYEGLSQVWRDGGNYVMLVDNWETTRETTVQMSSDGEHWFSLGTVFKPGPAGSWDHRHVYGPDVFWDGSKRRMLYYGVGRSAGIAQVSLPG